LVYWSLFLKRFQVDQIPGFLITFSRHRRTELNSSHLIPEYAAPIRFGTMIDDYREEFAASEARVRTPGYFELVCLKRFSSGSKSGL
jgi:hypothetical protein